MTLNDLTPTARLVMLILSQLEPPMSISDLAQATGATTLTIAATTQQLTSRGLMHRETRCKLAYYSWPVVPAIEEGANDVTN